MFKTVEELQSFLSWCRENGIVDIAVGDIKARIDPNAARIAHPGALDLEKAFRDAEETTKMPMEAVDRELLFYSSRK